MVTKIYSFPISESIKTDSKEEAINWLDNLKESILKERPGEVSTIYIAANLLQRENLKSIVNDNLRTPLIDDNEINRLDGILRIVKGYYQDREYCNEAIQSVIDKSEKIIRRLALRRLRHEMVVYEGLLKADHEPYKNVTDDLRSPD